MKESLDLISTVRHLVFPTWNSVWQIFILALLAGIFLTPFEYLVPAQKQNIWSRKGLCLDILYWFITPLLTRIITASILIAAIFAVTYPFQSSSLFLRVLNSSGWAATQPLWLQAIEIIILADFFDYWTHRFLHSSRFWKIHAIHHSPEEMNWISSSRVHPLNDLITRSCQILPIICFGFSASAILNIIPLISFYVMFLHSNIRWDFGPLRTIFVSPAYHRWHHTSDREGIDKNFAGIFPIWDILFGTYHFPKRLPKKYGVAGASVPGTLIGQLTYPFK